MPSGSQHRKLTRDFLGWDIPEVHRIMDAASAYLGGRHRVVGHNLRAFEAIELLFGRSGRIVATLHVLEDARIVVRTSARVAAEATGAPLPASERSGGTAACADLTTPLKLF